MKTNLVTVIINNMPIKVPNTFTVLQACEQASIEIPRFCYHEKLSVAGNCRMCLVEIAKSPKPVVSCAMPVMNDMRIFTDTPLVKKARESILEFLLINHPLDCPICDQGGECDLQDQTLTYGSDRSRFYEYKRGVEDKECGPIIKTIMTRCIHCTRCIRFSAEISGKEELGTIGRGTKTEIGTYVQTFIKSELSGNLVDLCPVGALTSKPYAFLSRNWELTKRDSIDYFDAICSNINVQTRQLSLPNKKQILNNKNFYPKDEILRILPKRNDFINENWISDKTRFSFDGIKQNRLDTPLYNNNNNLKKCKWEDLLSYIYILLDLNTPSKFYLNQYKTLVGLTGKLSDLKTIYYFFQFLNHLGSNNIQHEEFPVKINIDIPLFYQFNSTIMNIENGDLFLLVGVNTRYEASMVNVRLRKQFLKEDIEIGLIGNPVDLTYPYYHLGSSTKTLLEIAEGRHIFCKKLRNASNPILIFGTEALRRQDSEAIINLSRSLGKFSIIDLSKFKGYNLLHSNIGQMNSFELGACPGTRSLLHTKNTKNNILFLLEMDSIKKKKWLNLKKNKQLTKVIVQNSHKFDDMSYSNLVIPSTAPFEKNSLISNTEGRIQKASKLITPYGSSKDITKVLKGLSLLFQFNNIKQKKTNFSNKSLFFENPNLNKLNTISKKFNINYLNIQENNNKLNLSIFLPLVNNFYINDIIGKNSQIMSECSLLLNQKSNFLKK